jgi:hypothetical protein
MPDDEEDLRSTENSIIRDAARVKALEGRKAQLDPEDERVPELSAEVERVATGMRVKAVAERDIAEQIQVEKSIPAGRPPRVAPP